MSRSIFIAAALALAVTLPAVQAQAQAPRTFVSAAGNDSNPCSFAAPCRHFQAAVTATSAGGEVDALDPAGYGPIIISQAITIEGQGWSYIAPPANGNAILINAVSGKVTIRGVSLNGVGMANAIGILFNSGTSLNVQNSVIENFSRYGILFQPNGSSKISVSNTVVSDNNYGIYIGPTGSGTTNGALDHVHTDDNTNDGITVIRGGSQIVSVVVSDSVSANNGGIGVIATAVNLVTVRNSTITGNGEIGLEAAGGATMVVSRSTISGNGGLGWGADVNSELGTYADNSNEFNGNAGQIVLQYK
jgi:hypothetical protein